MNNKIIMENKINHYLKRMNNEKLYYNRQNDTKNDTKNDVNMLKPQNIIEYSRNTDILCQCDVLVVGGGPSGISAAIAAARTGVETVIIEKYGCLGGVITTVGMETLGWYRYEGTTDCTGIGIEMEQIASKMGGTRKWPYNDSECLDADFFKYVADKLIEENNIKPILHCYAVDCIIDNNTIKGIITESKSGRKAIMAKRVIDCTGDADICHFSGVPYNQLKKKDRMAVTTVFNVSGVDKKRFLEYVSKNQKTYGDWGNNNNKKIKNNTTIIADNELDWNVSKLSKEKKLLSPYFNTEFTKAAENGLIPKSSANLNGTWSTISDAGEATNLNLVHLKGYDCTNVMDLTKAEIEGRKQALDAIIALKNMVPGFENCKLRNFGMTLGTRDSRKIIGEYNLTEKDVTNQARFNDKIGIFPEFIDGYNILTLPTTGRYFDVPFRCLVPLKIDNLLVAGRCVAGDKISHAAMRNMMACTVTGQGAGVAAAISIINNKIVRNVNINLVQKELIRQGVTLWPKLSKL